MTRKRRILFGVNAEDEERLVPVRFNRSRRGDFILWGGIAMLSVLFIFLMIYRNMMLNPLRNMERSRRVSYMRHRGEEGMKEIASVLLDPAGRRDTVLAYLDLVCGDLAEDVRDQLAEALPDEKESELNCLVSLALCLIGDARGLPRFMYVLSTATEGSRRFKKANFFDSAPGEEHPLEKYFRSADDVEWAVKIVQDTLKHVFPGRTPVEARKSILAWWKANSGGDMDGWQRSFLFDSEFSWNRYSAFEYFFRRSWSRPELLDTAVRAMNEEKDLALRRYMAMKLFRRGVKDTIPILDEYVRNASKEEDYADILRGLPVFIELPAEFSCVDAWRGGRDDERSFEWFRDWWERNKDLLVFRDSCWHATGAAEDDPEGRLLDSSSDGSDRRGE